MILASNPLEQFKAHKKEIISEIKKTLNSGNYVLGSQVHKFEKSFSKFCDAKYAVGVNSGTDAILLSLKALNIGPGDEVITVSHTALATLSAIISSGAKPVIVDIEDDYYTIDPKEIKKAINKRTKAIIPVHIYGQPCDMKSVMKIAKKNKLFVIEDCAQSTGALYNKKKVGSIGDIGAFSFYPTKNLGAIGDGGIVVTNNKKIAEKIARIRQFGWDKKRKTLDHGQSSRLDELQAAILNVKIKHLNYDNQKRIKISNLYKKFIKNKKIILPKRRSGTKHVYHLYVILTDNRDYIIKKLDRLGIVCGIHYPVPAHLHDGYIEYCKFSSQSLKLTNSICDKVLTLPMYPELKKNEVMKVIKEINNLN